MLKVDNTLSVLLNYFTTNVNNTRQCFGTAELFPWSLNLKDAGFKTTMPQYAAYLPLNCP